MWITSKMMNVLVYTVLVVGLINTGIGGSTADSSDQQQTSTPTLDVSPTRQPEGDTTNVVLPDVSLFSSMSPSVELNSTSSSDVVSTHLKPMIDTASIQPTVYETSSTIYITEDSNSTTLVLPQGDTSNISPSFSSVAETVVTSMLDTMSIDLNISQTNDFEMEPSSDLVAFSDSSFVTNASSSVEQSVSSQIIASQNDSLVVFSDESSLTEIFSSFTDTADFMSSFSEFVDSNTSFSDIAGTSPYSEIIDSSVQYLDSLSFSQEVTVMQTTEIQSSPAMQSMEPTPSSVPPSPSSTSTSVPIQPSPTSPIIQPTSTPVVTTLSPDLSSAMYSSSITETETVTTSVKPPISDKSHGSDGLSSGGKAAIGIVVSLCIVGLIILGVYFYRKHNMTPGSFKQLLTNGVRYRTYNNPGYRDDEVEMDGTAMERFQ